MAKHGSETNSQWLRLNGMVKPAGIREILWYWPNIIGYVRIVCAIGSVAVPGDASQLSCFLYLGNCFLDFFDGPVARKMNQCSTFGGLLDVATDITSKQLFILRICAMGVFLETNWVIRALVAIFFFKEGFYVVTIAYQSGRGTYWKSSLSNMAIQRLYIDPKTTEYTWIGYYIQFFQNFFYAAVMLGMTGEVSWMWALVFAVPFVTNSLMNASVLYDSIRTWDEPAVSKVQ